MTAPKFIFGMLLVMVAVGTWSYMDGVSAGMIALRVVVAAAVLQIGYFLFILVAAWNEGRTDRKVASRKSAEARHTEAGELIDETSRSTKPFS